MDVETWRTATLTFAAIGQTAFMVMYAQLQWWSSRLGKALFYKGLTVMLVLDFFVLSRWWEWGARDEAFIVLYGLLAIGIWWQTVTFVVLKEGRGGGTGMYEHETDEDLIGVDPIEEELEFPEDDGQVDDGSNAPGGLPEPVFAGQDVPGGSQG